MFMRIIPLLFIALSACSAIMSPEVKSVSPSAGEDVGTTNVSIRIQFSKAMDKSTVESSFSLTKSGTYSGKMEGLFSWENETTVTFKPFSDQIDFPQEYSLEITSTAKDLDGNVLVRSHYSRFTVLSSQLRPEIVSSYPLAEATNISVLSSITLAFNLALDEGPTRNAFSLTPSLEGNLQVQSNLLIYQPNTRMEPGKYYTIKVDKSARSTSGSLLNNPLSISFFTGADLTLPVLLTVGTNQGGSPITNGQKNVEKTVSALYLDFNTPMDKDALAQGLTFAPNTSYYLDWLSVSNVAVRFWNTLLPSTNYSFTLASTVKSLSGWALTNHEPFRFTTDGFYSSLPFYVGANLDNPSNTVLTTNQINTITMGTTNLVEIVVHFSSATNMNLVSLYRSSRLKYLYGAGDPLKTGSIMSIENYSGNDYLYILANIGISNYYDLTFTGGQGGIEDVLQNPLSGTVNLFLYSTN